jgi:hypothetical protein
MPSAPARDGAADHDASTAGEAGSGKPDGDRRSRQTKRSFDTDRPRRAGARTPGLRSRRRARAEARRDEQARPREERLHAFSPVDGQPREMVVRYPTDRVWGQRPILVIVSNLLGLAVFIGVPVGGMVAAYRAGLLADPRDWPPVALAALAVFAPLAVWLLLVGLVDLVRGMIDLAGRRYVEGVVVRRRRFGGQDHTEVAGEPTRVRDAGGAHFLAVDEGRGKVIRAWRVPRDLYREVVEGTRIRATVSPTLRFVRDLEVAAIQPEDAGVATEIGEDGRAEAMDGVEGVEVAVPEHGDELPRPVASRSRALPAPPTDPTEKARALRPHRLDPVWLIAPDEASRALGRAVGAPRRTLGMVPPELKGGTIYGCTYVPADDAKGDYIGITVVEGPPARDFLQRGRRAATQIHGLGNEAWLGKRRVTVVKNGVVITIALHSRRVTDTGVALLRLARAASNRLR